MARIEKIETWSIYKEFEAPTLEAAIELAKLDTAQDWQYTGDDETSYFLGERSA